MKSSKLFLIASVTLFVLFFAPIHASGVEKTDARRAVGRDDDIRIDAQFLQDVISPSTSIGVRYEVQNLSSAAIAIADRVSDSSYDSEERTITLAAGSEIPVGGLLPHLVLIAPGETKALRAGALVRISSASSSTPRYLQLKVSLLRDVLPFAALIAQQKDTSQQPLGDALFEKWVEGTTAIFLNAIPVTWKAGNHPDGAADPRSR